MTPRTDRPVVTGWEITRRCNLACPHCYTDAGAANGELSTADALRIVDDLAALGAEVIGWTGGEPLLRDDLEVLAARAAAHGMSSGVTTNGLLLDARRAATLRAAGVDTVQVSLDGSTPERNRAMRGATPAQFERVVEGIGQARAAGLAVTMAMVLGESNLDDATEYVRLARELGVATVRFCGFVPSGRGRSAAIRARMEYAPDRARLRAVVDAMVAHVPPPHVYFDPGFGPLPPGWIFHRCVAGRETMYLSCSGDVRPCTSLTDPRFVVGNVHARPLAEIWNDPRMTEVSSIPLERIHGTCATCGHRRVCHAGCRGLAFAYTGDIRASNPVCLRP